jgi:cytochrome P450
MGPDLVHGHRRFVPSPGIPDLDVDPYAEDLLLDPYPFYRKLREAGPVVHIPAYNVLAVGRFDETREVFVDHEQFVSSRGVGLDDFALVEPFRPKSIILEVDPPEHRRTRRVLASAMSRSVVADLDELFTEVANGVIEQLPDGEVFDAVEMLAEAYPAEAFPRAVGMTDVHRRNLLEYSSMVFNAVGPDNPLRRQASARAEEFVPWVAAACTRERLRPGGLGEMVYNAVDEGDISEDEGGLLVRSLLTAGIDTTIGGIGGMLAHLAGDNDSWDRLLAEPDLVKSCVEEALRLDSPVHGFGRTARLDTEIAGHPVAEGTKVLCVLGAANTDPERWGDDADEFRVDRDPTGHLAFGAGVHICVGHALARAEMMTVLRVLLDRLSSFELAGDPVWKPNNSLRSLSSLPVRVARR